jgi:hypothetical protein
MIARFAAAEHWSKDHDCDWLKNHAIAAVHCRYTSSDYLRR